jgi:hypothetical protein
VLDPVDHLPAQQQLRGDAAVAGGAGVPGAGDDARIASFDEPIALNLSKGKRFAQDRIRLRCSASKSLTVTL